MHRLARTERGNTLQRVKEDRVYRVYGIQKRIFKGDNNSIYCAITLIINFQWLYVEFFFYLVCHTWACSGINNLLDF